MADNPTGASTAPPTPAPVASPAPAGPPPTVAPQPGAAATAPLFGGLRGGRARKDGLIPGSPEAVEADRKKDRERKARQRVALPPPLPSVHPGANDPGAALADGQGSLPGLAPDGEGNPPLPWRKETLKPIFDQLIPCLEELAVTHVSTEAAKLPIPGEMVKEIEADAAWPKPAKEALLFSAPELAAKYLNKTGISAENAPEVVCGTALAGIIMSHIMLFRRMRQLVVANNVARQPPETKPEEKKP